MPYQRPPFSLIKFGATGLGCAAGIILLPIFLVLKVAMLPFEKPLDRTPEEVLQYLHSFLDGIDGAWDWDNFTTQPISDPRLDDIRDRLAALDVPLSEADLPAIMILIAETEVIAAEKYAAMRS
jgi:hypothetical protein